MVSPHHLYNEMKKIIQITNAAAENGESLYALTEDGKVYIWGSEEKIVPIPEDYRYATALQRSNGVKEIFYGWIEMIDNLTPTNPDDN